jgi:6-carboxyhexanoate--CoA ligase
MRASKQGQHISGAEGIYDNDEVTNKVRMYTERALFHEKGKADDINIIVEELRESTIFVPSLNLCTLNTRTPDAVRKAVAKILTSVGITERAVDEAYKLTRMRMTKNASKILSKKLSSIKLNNFAVKEALVLASKAHKHPMLLGELCISDDPSYTTGYVVTRKSGYVRLPRIKKRGIPYGGRAFFITGGEVKDLIKYLQKTPVLVNKIKNCSGIVSLKDLLERKSHR